MNRLPDLLARRARAACTSLFVLCLVVGAASAQQVVDPTAVRRISTDPFLAQRAQRFAALARSGAVAELGVELQRASEDAGLSPLAREWLLDRGLNEATRLTPTPGLRATVASIAQRRPEVFVRADPDHGDRAVPLYDPGAMARFVLRGWTRAEARDRTALALQASLLWPIERFAQDATPAELDATKAGILEAFRAAAPETLARYRSAVVAAIDRGERVDELAAVVAELLGDVDLQSLVIDRADATVALGAVQRARALFGDAAALDVLINASRRPELASAALLEIGRLAQDDPRARAYLFSSIDDAPLAASAATALASLHDPAVASELGRRLRAEPREWSRRHLVLALKLDGSTAARSELETFARIKAGSAELQKEVRAWLAQ